MQKQSEIEERILGLIMGIGIGTILGFLLRAAEHWDNHRQSARTAPSASGTS
jgi:hypothetical protein